jgi:16S rRNA (guanine966-N2)-methyltransferase
MLEVSERDPAASSAVRLDLAAWLVQSGPTRAGSSYRVIHRATSPRGVFTMRIIAGELRGRRIAAPAGRTTRPTPDRVRGALFSALESRLGGPGSLEGLRVLDLFAGSGALGIESLSRGAVSVTFVEHDRAALSALTQNLKSMGVESKARVVAEDAVRALDVLQARGDRFDAAFLDPPYGAPEAELALAALGLASLVHAGGILVLEHATADAPPEHAGLALLRTRAYGSVSLTLYEVRSPGESGPRTEEVP